MALITLRSERVEEKYGSRLVAGHVPPTRSLKLALPLTQSLPQTYNPGQKYMVHLENLPCFHYRPCSMIKAALFPTLGPPPYTMLLQGGHFECTDPTLYGGEGGGGGGGGMMKLSKKAKCTITFDQDCRPNPGEGRYMARN